jgi:glycosyltransferase involved in cell wall biosynthesis
MHWLRSATDAWRLTRFIPNADEDLRFVVTPATYTIDRSRKHSGLSAWADFFKQGNAAWSAALKTEGRRGIITAFPPLPVITGLRKRASFISDIPIVAWTFNLGQVYPGMRQHLSRVALARVNRFVVHSRAEIATYSEWLDLPPERFEFVPFETPIREVKLEEDLSEPFILSMGSAQRDYRLLFQVMAELKHPTLVIAGPHAVAGLTPPPNVTVKSGLTPDQCFELVQRARFSVIPVANRSTASGQVTLLDAMMYGRAAIITECPASVDYVVHGKDALLVRHGDHDDMKAAIQRLWEDAPLRRSLGVAARQTGIELFSEEAVGRTLGRILRSF